MWVRPGYSESHGKTLAMLTAKYTGDPALSNNKR
jgi:hypothetical protein